MSVECVQFIAQSYVESLGEDSGFIFAVAVVVCPVAVQRNLIAP